MLRPARLLLLLLCLPALARAQTDFGLGKVARAVQTGPDTLVPDPSAPFQFNALSSVVGSLSLPNGSTVSLSYVAADADYEALQSFSTQALMDAAFPSGSYIFDVDGATVPLTITGDLYPPVPQLTNGAWNSSGQLVIDPTQAYNFNFSAFSNYATTGAGGQVEFTIETNSGTDLVDLGFFSLQIPAVPDGYTLAAGTLQAGSTYTGILSYGIESVVTESSSYGLLISAYGRATTFTIIAQAPPSAPAAVTQPQSQTVAAGSTAVFTFAASGSPYPSYQWFLNGSPLAGPAGTQATLVVSGAAAANAGTYTCTASNASGSVQSNPATLAVSATADVGRLVNLSCRAGVGTGGNILITGFAVGGAGTSGTDSLLIRASGPALVPFGVTGPLADPDLGYYSGSTEVASNQAWGGSASISSAAAAVGAFAWSSASSHDAALLVNPAVGAYTAQVAGESGDTGVALAEVYDTTPAGTYTVSRPRLTNLSARVQVGTGGNILIAGFVIGGSTSKTVLIRASGPALVPFGVAGTLADPKLQLLAGTSVLATNTGWAANPQITAAASAVGAFSWGAAGTADSAILVTLPPGAYTAEVSGAGGDTGVALVEVYEVP